MSEEAKKEPYWRLYKDEKPTLKHGRILLRYSDDVVLWTNCVLNGNGEETYREEWIAASGNYTIPCEPGDLWFPIESINKLSDNYNSRT